MIERPNLALCDSHLFSDRENPLTNRISTAVFFVRVVDTTTGEPAEYKLVAMDGSDYDAWCLDQAYANSPSESIASRPLVVADEQRIAAGGLVTFVQTTYLNPEEPSGINAIHEFLEGPIKS
jgi:hypothetical protein